MKLSEKTRTAVLDMSWHVDFMNLSNVICYISVAIKALEASNLVTFEPLLAKMPILVLNLVAFGCEASVAVLTFVRFISRMDPLMK